MGKTVLVTGGAGFIGSAVVRLLHRTTEYRIVNVDKLTYAGSLDNVADVTEEAAATGESGRYVFEQVDIVDAAAVSELMRRHQPDAIMHLAAESHVDRSIDGPRPFVDTNVLGTYVLLEEARRYLADAEPNVRDKFRFVHVSTDEVYGSLGAEGRFTEETAYDPSSPYSASKASADHLVRAWHRTFGLPAMVTNCSNNFGPYQYPEKLIPVAILKLLAGDEVPVYGTGGNVRDWLYVEDHAEALLSVLERGEPGRTYNVGADNERTNLELVKQICTIMEDVTGRSDEFAGRIRFVQDRPGHDFRYAIDASRIRGELGWKPRHTHDEALRATVSWYVDNQEWCRRRLEEGQGAPVRLGLGASGG